MATGVAADALRCITAALAARTARSEVITSATRAVPHVDGGAAVRGTAEVDVIVAITGSTVGKRRPASDHLPLVTLHVSNIALTARHVVNKLPTVRICITVHSIAISVPTERMCVTNNRWSARTVMIVKARHSRCASGYEAVPLAVSAESAVPSGRRRATRRNGCSSTRKAWDVCRWNKPAGVRPK